MKIKRTGWLGQLLAILAGALITLASAPFNFWPLAFIAPAALLFLLNQLTPLQALLRGWFFGLGVFGSGASWVYVSIHVHGGTPMLLAALMTGLFTAALAIFFALHAWIWQRFFNQRWWLLAWPALWVLMEALRSWIFTGFPWLLVGTTQLNSPLAGWAPVLGVYGVSGLSVLLAALILFGIRPRQRPRRQQLAALVTAASLLLSGQLLTQVEWTQAAGEPLTAGLVQGNIPQEDKWNPAKRNLIIERYLELSKEAGAVDLILWPETALPLTPSQAQPFFDLALQQAGPETALITGLASPAPETNRFYNSLIAIGPTQQSYHKVKLVPFGEYLPFETWLRGLINFFDLPMSSFIPGPDQQDSLSVHQTRVAPLICYEVAYPDFSARQALDTDWLLTVSNDSWFGRSIGPLQHFQIARFRALETGREMARVTNNGITALIDSRGQVKSQLPQFSSGVLKAEIQPHHGATPFMQYGSWPLWLACLFLLAWLSLPRSSKASE